MSEPTVSVAMATYNGERFLQEQLDSLAQQTLLPCELVVTDDDSTDGTVKILQDFQSKAPFEVKIYRNSDQLGHCNNFEKALSLCSGDLIFLSDQDDVWFPNKIGRVVFHFAAYPRLMVVINDQIIANEKLLHNGVTALGNVRSVGARNSCFASGCCTALRHEWRDLTLPIPVTGMGHDYWINTLADALDVRLILAEPLQLYRRHGMNASNWLMARSSRRLSALEIVHAYRANDPRPAWRREIDVKRLYGQRLVERADLLQALQLEDVKACSIERLGREIEVLERRIGLMDLPRWRRLLAVARFSVDGGYSNFLGWKSALNDILR